MAAESIGDRVIGLHNLREWHFSKRLVDDYLMVAAPEGRADFRAVQ